MADRRLLDRFDPTLAEAFRRTVRNCGGEIWEANGVVSWATSLAQASPAHANGVMRLDRLMSGHEVLSITSAFFRARGHGYTVLARADDRALTAKIEGAGSTVGREHAALMLSSPATGGETPEGVEIRRVKDPTGMLDFCATVIAAAPSNRDMQRFVNLALRRIQALAGPTNAAFLVYHRRTAVACALSMLVDGVAFIGWISTKPEYRRQGLATTVTAAAIRAGFDQGAVLAAALSPVASVPFFTTMGFEQVGQYREYVFPPPP